MKLLDPSIICKGFAICLGYMSSDDEYINEGEHLADNGQYSQLIYIIDGNGAIYNMDGTLDQVGVKGNVYNLEKYYRGQGYIFRTPKENGSYWFCINPIPSNKIFDYEVIKEGESKLIVGDGVERTIICVEGTIEVNGKELGVKQYARVLNEKTAEVKVNSKSAAVYIWDSGRRQGKNGRSN